MSELEQYAGADGLTKHDSVHIMIELMLHLPHKLFAKWYNLQIMDDKTINSNYIYAKEIQSTGNCQ